jgi:hypothetical protein
MPDAKHPKKLCLPPQSEGVVEPPRPLATTIGSIQACHIMIQKRYCLGLVAPSMRSRLLRRRQRWHRNEERESLPQSGQEKRQSPMWTGEKRRHRWLISGKPWSRTLVTWGARHFGQWRYILNVTFSFIRNLYCFYVLFFNWHFLSLWVKLDHFT